MPDISKFFQWIMGIVSGAIASLFGSSAHEKIKETQEARGALKAQETTQVNTGSRHIQTFFFGPSAGGGTGEPELLAIGMSLPAVLPRIDTAYAPEWLAYIYTQTYELIVSLLANKPMLSMIDCNKAAGMKESLLNRHIVVFGSPEDNIFLEAFCREWNPNAAIQYKNRKFVHRTLGEENQIIESIYPRDKKDGKDFFYGGVFRFLNHLGYVRTLIFSLDPEYLLAVISALARTIGDLKKCGERNAISSPSGTAMIIKGHKQLGTAGCLKIEVNQ